MGCTLEISGHIVVGSGSSCGSGCSSGEAGKYQPLDFGCGGLSYDRIQSTDCPTRIGSAEAPLPASEGIASAELLFVRATSPVTLLFGGSAPEAAGAAIAEPLTFAGTETFAWRLLGPDGTEVYAASAAFTAGAKTRAQIKAVLNAAAVAGGADDLPVSSSTGGILTIGGPLGAYQIEVTTALALIGFSSTGVLATGEKQTEISTTIALFQTERGAGLKNLRCIGPADVSVLVAGT